MSQGRRARRLLGFLDVGNGGRQRRFWVRRLTFDDKKIAPLRKKVASKLGLPTSPAGEMPITLWKNSRKFRI
jgi:hypothetical protein